MEPLDVSQEFKVSKVLANLNRTINEWFPNPHPNGSVFIEKIREKIRKLSNWA
jgi:hypothetical protein